MQQSLSYTPNSLADLGSGAGLPGILLQIYNQNTLHVKLYEKSKVKRNFLERVKKSLGLKFSILGNIYKENIDSQIIVCRAFKKLDRVIQVSREIAKKSHKMIILKGENAQKELNKSFKSNKYPYKLVRSISNIKSKIIVMEIKK